VRTARSWRPDFLFSPKPGALIAHTYSKASYITSTLTNNPNNQEPTVKQAKRTLIPARSLFRISVARASLSTSSAIINNGLCL